MSKRYKRLLSVIISIVLLAGIATAVGAVDIFSLKNSEQAAMASDSDTIILRVCNWEEYIDTGDWDEAIELDSGEIKGENSIVKDFEDWYYQIYGKKVVVEYSTPEQKNQEIAAEMYFFMRPASPRCAQPAPPSAAAGRPSWLL